MLRRLFPTLAEIEPVKLMAAPLVVFLLLGILGGILDLLFGTRVLD